MNQKEEPKIKDGVQGCITCGEPLEPDDYLSCYWCYCKSQGIDCTDRDCYSARICGPACKYWSGDK